MASLALLEVELDWTSPPSCLRERCHFSLCLRMDSSQMDVGQVFKLYLEY
jgi:hypothetical protein